MQANPSKLAEILKSTGEPLVCWLYKQDGGNLQVNQALNNA